MKKTVLLSLALAGVAPAAMAEPVTLSPEIMQGISLSPDGFYVGGTTMAQEPAVWNVGAASISFEEYVSADVNGVANNGTACGSTANDEAFLYNPSVAENTMTILPTPDNSGATAWAITTDGSIAVGCIFDPESWAQTPCYWENGEYHELEFKNVDTPFENNGATARGVSGDGSIIFGYIEDFGSQPVVLWLRNEESGEYEYVPLYDGLVDKTGNMELTGEYPYFQLTPTAISNSGEWLTLQATPWDSWEDPFTARMNLFTQEIEIAEMPSNYMGASVPTAVADDGTVVGFCYPGGYDQMIGRVGMVWPAGQSAMELICYWLPLDQLADMDAMSNTPCAVTPDGNLIEGFYVDSDGGFQTYIINVEECRSGVASVDSDKAETIDGVYDLSGRRVADRPFNLGKGIYIVKKSTGAEKIMVK